METYAKPFEDAFNTMKKDYETKGAAFERDKKTLSEAVLEVKYGELMDLQNRITKYGSDTEEKLQKKESELMLPIYQSIDKAVREYGAANGYDYIYNAEALLFAKDSDDLTNALITKMGGKIAPKTATGTSSAPAPKPAAGR